jgi:hypothetical protein
MNRVTDMAGQMQVAAREQKQAPAPAQIQLPAPTAWPIVLAFGLALVFVGMVTTSAISILGAILSIFGVVGWFRNVLPHEAHETVLAREEAPVIQTQRSEVERMEVAEGLKRAWLPIEVYPVSAGIKGGLAGAVAMALLATLYGVVSHRSVWYPINLLAAGFFPRAAHATMAQLTAFHPTVLLLATVIHLFTSLVAGLLYGAALPMFPRRPILLGGLVAPVIWSGLLYTTLDIINPVLNHHISWPWFVLSQIGFGVVAGLVVVRQQRIRTWQHLPFALRAGIEAPGAMREKDQE